MKTLTNHQTTIKQGDALMTYADLLVLCANNAPPGGFTPEVMAARLRVVEAAKKAAAAGFGEPVKVELEDADAASAKDAVNGMRWAVANPDIVAFTEAVRAL